MTLRAGSSVAVFALVAVGATVLFGDAAIRGSWPVAVRTAAIALLVVWAAWLLLFRPSIRVRADRAVVVNVGRITEVPWARIVDVRRRLQLVLDLDDGRSLECWGSPFPRRRMVGRVAATQDDDPAVTVLRGAWMSGGGAQTAAAGDAPAIVRRVDTIALVIGAAAVVVAVLLLSLVS
jgi:hypothetical protein